MRISILTIGAVASIIAINSVFADTIVTSQSYVDNRDALKQDKITAGTTGNVVTYNGTQNGQAQFSERAIFDPDTNFDYENNEVATGHEGDLVTAESIFPDVGNLYQSQRGPENTVVMYNGLGYLGGPGGSRGVCDATAEENGNCENNYLVTRDVLNNATDLPRTTTTNKVCIEWVAGQSHTDANCLLWNLTDQVVYGCLASGASCTSSSQCCGGLCRGGVCEDEQY